MNLIVYPDGSAEHVPTHLLDPVQGHVPHPFEQIPLPAWLQPQALNVVSETTPAYLQIYSLFHR